jgi:hypothetical protein
MFQKRYARRWIAVGLFIVVVGIIFEALLAISGTPEEQAANWPTTAGQVLNLQIRTLDSNGATLEAPVLVVDYRYAVEGTPYIGSQSIYRFKTAEEGQAAFQPGKTLVVFYNPNAPLQSLIEIGPQEPESKALLQGPHSVLLGTACVASLPFIAIGLALALGGSNISRRNT